MLVFTTYKAGTANWASQKKEFTSFASKLSPSALISPPLSSAYPKFSDVFTVPYLDLFNPSQSALSGSETSKVTLSL